MSLVKAALDRPAVRRACPVWTQKSRLQLGGQPTTPLRPLEGVFRSVEPGKGARSTAFTLGGGAENLGSTSHRLGKTLAGTLRGCAVPGKSANLSESHLPHMWKIIIEPTSFSVKVKGDSLLKVFSAAPGT